MTRRPGSSPRNAHEARGATPEGGVDDRTSGGGDASGAILGRWTLVLDDYLPPSVNELLRVHWAKRARLKNETYLMVVAAQATAAVPVLLARGKRRVSVTLTVVNRSHAPDPDNTLKSLMDACVKARLLVDDRAEWCELGRVEVVKGARKRTEILLEDVG